MTIVVCEEARLGQARGRRGGRRGRRRRPCRRPPPCRAPRGPARRRAEHDVRCARRRRPRELVDGGLAAARRRQVARHAARRRRARRRRRPPRRRRRACRRWLDDALGAAHDEHPRSLEGGAQRFGPERSRRADRLVLWLERQRQRGAEQRREHRLVARGSAVQPWGSTPRRTKEGEMICVNSGAGGSGLGFDARPRVGQ